jgi:tRNA pseudouridine38-40 synthase
LSAVARLTVAYDGGPFAGWARQPGLRTVQEELERALAVVLRAPVTLSVAGRTDAGVHALGQVASYAGALPRLPGVNALLPPQIVVLAAEEAAAGFDARRSARSRTYSYRVLARPEQSPFERGRALHWPYPVDREALDACAATLAGEHDFTAFTPTSCSAPSGGRARMGCSSSGSRPTRSCAR